MRRKLDVGKTGGRRGRRRGASPRGRVGRDKGGAADAGDVGGELPRVAERQQLVARVAAAGGAVCGRHMGGERGLVEDGHSAEADEFVSREEASSQLE